MHEIQKRNFLTNDYFFGSAFKVPPNDFIQNISQAPFKCLKKQIKVDKLDYIFQKRIIELRKSFKF